MHRVLKWTGVGMGLVVLGLATPAVAGSRVERPGTAGLIGGGSYGVLNGDSRFANEFDSGIGLNLGLRYVVAPHWSVGANFQSNRYDARTLEPGGATKVQMTNVQAELYFYRDRNQDASQYLVAGIGFYRPELHNDAEEISFPGENLLLSVGVGAEVFIKENWGLDLGARALGYFGNGFTDQEMADAALEIPGNFSFAFQGQIGLLYYLLR